MMDYSKKNPNASYYEMLLRAAMGRQEMAAEISDNAQGLIGDFRILTILKTIADHCGRGSKIKTGDLVGSVQGDDLQRWLFDITWKLPTKNAAQCRLYWQDAIVGLKRAKAQKTIDTATVEAHRALKDGNQERYAELLADMHELRRKTKKIIY